MFAPLKTFISDLVGEAMRSNRFTNDDCRVETVALLINAITIDSGMSHARRDKLHATLKSYFGCDDTATIKLIEQAAKSCPRFGRSLPFHQAYLLFCQRRKANCIVQMMWTVLYADGIVSPLESNIVWRTADLLGVSSRHRVELRHRIAAEKRAARD
jgi:uncharacterized tellurite resistance protein B-like protein